MRKEFIFGYHAVGAALEHTPDMVQSIYLQVGKQDKSVRHITQLAVSRGINVTMLSHLELTKHYGQVRHQGIVAEVLSAGERYLESALPQLIANSRAKNNSVLLLVLDGIQDPHNLGACLRTANATGVTAVIAPKDNAVGLTPVVQKVASGAAVTTPFIQVTNLVRTLKLLQELNIWLYGTCERASQDIYSVKFDRSMALVVGAEGKGMRRLTRETCDFLVTIPMLGDVSSLNVSVATGVCLFEAVRQCYLNR